MSFRFSTVLVVALLGMLLSMAALVTVTSYVNAKSNAESLSAVVLSQAAERVGSRVQSQLDIAQSQSVLNERLIARGMLTPARPEELARYLVDAMTAEPQLSYLSFGLEATGNMIIVTRTAADVLEIRYLERTAAGTLQLSDYHLRDGKLERIRLEVDKSGNDPRPRPYYVAARAAHRAVWTETYNFFSAVGELDRPGVTYATPVYAADGALYGVLSADFDLRAVSHFLGSLELFEHGLAFVVENRENGTRRLIAHPDPDILAPASAGREGRELLTAEQVADPRVVAMAQRLPPGRSDGVPPAKVVFALGDTKYIGYYRPLVEGNLHWTVCVLAPEEDILGRVHRANRTTAAIVSVGVALAIVVALLLGSFLARPLQRLAEDTLAIGRFELESVTHVRSPFREVDRLSTALEEMKRGLRSFRRYVPAELVNELLKSGREAQVGGARRTLTIHFSDIAGFTSIAEDLAPEALVTFLGDYLEAMTESIHRSGGTVDKYIGDAIMAFWGAPREDAQHALHACEAALSNRARLLQLNAEWEKQGRPRFDARAAIHTGDVVVGNIGSGAKLEYTVIGDAVNLASRLEGLNKRYGTSLLVSEDTWRLVKEHMVGRPLARVSVKGKAKSVEIYELIGRRGEVVGEQLEAAVAHTEAFALFLARRWHDAAVILRERLAARPDDLAAQLLLERCDQYETSPPGEEWDGSEKMRTK